MRRSRAASWRRGALAGAALALIGIAGQSVATGQPAVAVAVAVKPTATLFFAHAPIAQDQAGMQDLTSATATFTPAQKNAVVEVQRLDGKTWRPVLTGKQSSAGKYVFAAPAGPPYSYRVKSTVAGKVIYSPTVRPALYPLKWSEEFNTFVLSPDWIVRPVGGAGTMRPCSSTGLTQVSVNGESANLAVLRDGSRIPNKTADCPNGQYLNAMVGTQYSHGFLYGIIAARVRMESERGMHGSIWMQHVGLDLTRKPTGGNDDGGPLPPLSSSSSTSARDGRSASWPAVPADMTRPSAVAQNSCGPLTPATYGHPENDGAEIDIIEYFGDTYRDGGTSMNNYWPAKDVGGNDVLNHCGAIQPSVPKILGAGRTPASGYHVFSVEWTPTQYIFRTDGFETFRTAYGISRQPEYVIMSLLTSDWELPALRSGQPALMNVDWVRVWQP
ncbi:MAG TPA: family 16 glycosylhydrolase [Sporichthyaceae bacterium]|nr:family 16 glycosylhydrolase [Sporichthyaceae bacterium]